MFANMKSPRMRFGQALLACSAAWLFAVTGCSSGGTSSSTPVSGSALSGSSSNAPSWAAALGSGATVVPPGTAISGHGSPAAAVVGLLQAVKLGGYSGYCGYLEPSVQAQCKSALSQVSASQFPTVKNWKLGYIVIEGTRAVAGITGTLCATGQTGCTTNTDPAALFTTLHTFNALWKNAIKNTATQYSLTPLIQLNGQWYIYANS